MSSASTSEPEQRKRRKHSRRSTKSSKKYSQVILAVLMVAILVLAIISLVNVDEVKSVPNGVADVPNEEVDPADSANWEMLLKTGTDEELLDALVSSENRKSERNPLMNYVGFSQRAAIAERLLQADLKETKKQYVTSVYIESLTTAELINIAAKLNLDGSREKALQVGRQYENDSHPEIAAAAYLMPILIHLYDYWGDRDPRQLDLVRARFDQGQQKILSDRTAATLFVSVIFRLKNDSEFQAEATSLLMHVLGEFENQATPENADLLTSFRDLLFFGDMELLTLPTLVLDEDPFANEQSRRFFDVLSRNPKAGIKVYRKAIQVVDAYKQTDQEQLATIFEKRLRDTALRIEDAEKRETVLAEIANPLLIPEVESAEDQEFQLGLPDLTELETER